MHRVPRAPLFLLFIIAFSGSLYYQIGQTDTSTPNQLLGNVDRVQDSYSEIATSTDALDSESIFSTNELLNFKYILNSSWITVIIILATAFIYLRFVNSTQLRYYITNALKIAGFKGQVPSYSRFFQVSNRLGIELYGLNSLHVRLTVPLFNNYQYYGLRKMNSIAYTEAPIEGLQIKLMVIQKYLQNN